MPTALPPSLIDAVLERLRVSPRDRILELECGEGEASGAIAGRVSEGLVVAMDASDGNIQVARARASGVANLMFIAGNAGEIPWQEDFFSKALSYGCPRDLLDVFRVLMPGGLLGLVLAPGVVNESRQAMEAAGFTALEEYNLPENVWLLVSKKTGREIDHG